MSIKKQFTRTFDGKTDGFTDKSERSFEQKHLKAYLKGNETFQYGFKINSFGQRVPSIHKVKQTLIENK